MRGKVVVQSAEHFDQGITPAYAGKRSGNHVDQVGNRDHPRLCGEKLAFSHLLTTILGSPPPMRGKANSGFPTIDRYRITPAYAGKSKIVKRFWVSVSGSPPPMRGKASRLLSA